jgi:hypothetical protein
MTLEKVAALVGIVAGLLAIWEGVARIAGGDGPITVIQNISDGPTPGPTTTSTTVPTIPTNGGQLATPSDVSVSGDCESGFTLTWQKVEGAERYRIESDGSPIASVTNTDYLAHPFPDNHEHSYRVTATAFQHDDSEPSDEVTVGPCSF